MDGCFKLNWIHIYFYFIEIIVSYGNRHLVLQETAKVFSKTVLPFCISTSKDMESLLLYTFTSISFISVLDFGHSNMSTVIFHCNILCGLSFPILISHLYILFSEVPVHKFCPFLNWVVVFLFFNFKSFFFFLYRFLRLKNREFPLWLSRLRA